MSRITLSHLKKMKARHEKIAMLTGYDATFSKLLSDAGLDVILVGDTLGMTIGGHSTTVPVTLQDMIYHTQNVCRAQPKSLIIVDMPYMSYANPDIAIENAARLMQAGGELIKLEGGVWLKSTIEKLTERGIPICAHLGLTPQSIHMIGGYKVQGRETQKAKELLETALSHQASGAQMLILECVPWQLSQEITQTLDIPVIGIGAGPHCDGQVLVTYDMLGMTPGKPFTFVKNFLLEQTQGISAAVKDYIRAVKTGTFPTLEHSFS
ncbi:MAG: panB [Gammaproteobacteria bacterium]|jgi:3-methyl-2-oxobutanoate hydroxymethyltransferase|nr:panB [Gammaproteobacteria bacterium]